MISDKVNICIILFLYSFDNPCTSLVSVSITQVVYGLMSNLSNVRLTISHETNVIKIENTSKDYISSF